MERDGLCPTAGMNLQMALNGAAAPSPASRKTVMPQLPLLRPLGGGAQPRTASQFSSAVSDNRDDAAVFVRPDVPPDDDVAQAPRSPWKRPGGKVAASGDAGRTAFNSALEQASYLTNQSEASRSDSRRSGLLGLGIFGL